MGIVVEHRSSAKKLISAIVLLLVKYGYIFITIEILSGLSYAGNAGYGISFNLKKEIISSIIFIIELIILFKLKRPSEFQDNTLFFFFVVYFIPLNSISSLVDASYEFIIAANIFCILFIICISINNKSPKLHVVQDHLDTSVYEGLLYSKTVSILCFILCTLFILYKISFNGFYFSADLGADIYTTRLENISLIKQSDSGLIGLVIAVLTNLTTFIAPLYLLISIKTKKMLAVLVAVICMLSQFAIFSMKTTVLLIPIVFIISLFKKERKMKVKSILITASAVIFGVMILLWEVWNEGRIYYMLFRRMEYLPTWLNTIYFDFFSNNPKLFFTDEVIAIKKILPHVYEQPILKIISDTYFSGEIASPNNGMFSEGFMQLGYMGIIVFPVIYKLLFDWCDRVYEKFGKQVQLFISILLIINLPNVGAIRSDFVLSFVLMTFIIQYVSRFHINKRLQITYSKMRKFNYQNRHNNDHLVQLSYHTRP